jgi:REP element-mobilizing transposase RayT
MKKEYSIRKEIRLKNYDYSRNGLYFITICTKDKIPYLSEINGVGDGVLDVPQHKLTEYGTFVNDQIKEINSIYEKIKIIKYVIMPDHVHMIIYIFDEYKIINGTSRTPSPTNKKIPSVISALKRFVNKKTGFNIWQRSYYDHIIRNKKEFFEIFRYIENNPLNWINNNFNQNICASSAVYICKFKNKKLLIEFEPNKAFYDCFQQKISENKK